VSPRYTVTRSHDCQGGRYATGPLTFYAGEDLGQAQREVIARGGELIDHVDRMGWEPSLGWFPCGDYLDTLDD
jgi:hypothetical protein